MPPSPGEINQLREILDHIKSPDMLDEHPWAFSILTRDMVDGMPALQKASPGMRLIAAVSRVFADSLPALPPKKGGKRLDSRWGEFGILAAMYFAPMRFGSPRPSSLREAWGRIDKSILLFVFGETADLSEEQIERYKLVGDETEVAPVSTLSDWHRKGIRHLYDAVRTREKFLMTRDSEKSTTTLDLKNTVIPPQKNSRQKGINPILKKLFLLLFILLFIGFTFVGFQKARRLYTLTVGLRQDIAAMQTLAASPSLDALNQSGPILEKLRNEFDALEQESRTLIWLTPLLKWVPVYGGDLAASRQMLELSGQILDCATGAHAAFMPVLNELGENNDLKPDRLVQDLNDARSELVLAQDSCRKAALLRNALEVDDLSAQTRKIIEEDLDRLMPLMEDGLTAAIALPTFLGGSSEGPKTYLLLVQNEDELRPTGGFITAVGTVVLENGRIVSLDFMDSGSVDNWERPYPLAPWQLDHYMNSPVLVLRDANWFTDFPTTALYAETLYAYHNSHSVDGVIAFDQHMLVMLLQALGPVQVPGAVEAIDATNVIEFMRASKSGPITPSDSAEWSRKGFIEDIAIAVSERIFQGDVPWQDLARAVLSGLNERHLLINLDDDRLSDLLDRQGWNGALLPEPGDFLMVVNTNIGFNKTNAVVSTYVSYDVDLTDLEKPVASMVVNLQNDSSPEVECVHWGGQRLENEEDYPINACYWNYLRVYVPQGAELLKYDAQDVPNEWMLLGRGQAGRIDLLEEDLPGLEAFGTLMVVPGGESIGIGFGFALPATVLRPAGNEEGFIYRLKIKKQPGTLSIPLTIRIHLPRGTTVHSVSEGVAFQGNNLMYKGDLQVDRTIEVWFGGD